jgi:7TMR-DISM extracellular 2/7TM diverse intracellular signalling
MTNKPSSLIYSNLGKWLTAIVLTVPIIAILIAVGFVETSSNAAESEPTKVRGENILVYIDSDNSKEIEDIEKMSHEEFSRLEGNAVPNFGFNRSNIWLKFELDPENFEEDNLILEIKNPVLDIVDIYEYQTTELHQIGETGDLLPFSSRPIDHRNYRFPISLAGSAPKKFFVKINSGGEQLYAPIIIWNNSQLQTADLNDQLLIGTYFGIILFVLLFNLFIYLILKERSNLYYVQYNVNLMLLQLCLTGYSFQFIWPNSPYLANVTNPFFASIAVFALLKFSQNFLELKNY